MTPSFSKKAVMEASSATSSPVVRPAMTTRPGRAASASATARPMPDVPPITTLTVFSLKSMIAGPESVVGWKGIHVEHQLDEQASRDGNEHLQLARLRDDGFAVAPAPF